MTHRGYSTSGRRGRRPSLVAESRRSRRVQTTHNGDCAARRLLLYWCMSTTPSAARMPAVFDPRRAAAIARRIHVLTTAAARRWDRASAWSADALPRLADFASRGKLVRGQLVLLGAELAGVRQSRTLFDCAAALELFHSSILIHDDLIDNDAVRRGTAAMHIQLADAVRARGERMHAAARGTALAMCTADCGFFLTFNILAQLALPEATRRELLTLWSKEFALVTLAEMDDVHLSPGATPAPREAIWRVYQYKTARYTFCLPLMTGLIVARAPAALRRSVLSFGENLGLLFQLKDDELGLFGTTKETGKPVGTDIIQCKKTLYHHYLLTCTPPEVQKRLRTLFGAPHLRAQDVAYVQRIVRESGIDETLHTAAADLAARARRIATRLPVPPALQAQLLQLVNYSTARTS